MPWVAAAIVVSAGIGAHASKKASEAQQGSAAEAAALQQQQMQQYAPWIEAGETALGKIESLQGMSGEEVTAELEKTPGYQFRLEQGLKALQRSAGTVSGNLYKGLMEYGQDYASAEYSKYYNRLASLAGLGQTAVGGQSQVAATQGGYIQAGGEAQAAGILGQSSAYQTGLGQLASFGMGAKGGEAISGNVSYYPAGETSGYGGQNVPGDAYAPAYGGG